MAETLYLECNSGISGDMLVAALLDLGGDWDKLTEVLNGLDVQEKDKFSVEKIFVNKSGIKCMDFNVVLSQDNHDHDMEYLHGHEHSHEDGHGHVQDDNHNHEMEHEHTHEGHHEENHPHHSQEVGHHHEHRGMAEIKDIISKSSMSENAKNIANRIFYIIAESESKAHGIPVDQVHFHEVGAMDSIVDVISIAFLVDNLNIENVIVTGLNEGTGTVRCQHGILSVPVPAVSNIVSAYKIPIHIMDEEGEFVTPTGAAAVAALMTDNELPQNMIIKKIGLGAGKRNYRRPSILRGILIEDVKDANTEKAARENSDDNQTDFIYKLESNIDDCTGEQLGFLMDILFEKGAKDVHYFPVFMKKNRPAWQLNVICSEDKVQLMEEEIFKNTTTIGIRKLKMERTILPREIIEVKTTYGNVRVKKCMLKDCVRYYPEYDDVAAVCKNTGLTFEEVYRNIIAGCGENKN